MYIIKEKIKPSLSDIQNIFKENNISCSFFLRKNKVYYKYSYKNKIYNYSCKISKLSLNKNSSLWNKFAVELIRVAAFKYLFEIIKNKFDDFKISSIFTS